MDWEAGKKGGAYRRCARVGLILRLTRLQAVNRVLLVHDVERCEKLLHSRLAFAEAEHRKLRFGLQRQRACQRTFE